MRSSSFLIMLLIMLSGCDSADECFQASGDMVSKQIVVADFTMINVGEGLEVVIRQSAEKSVMIYSGENIIDQITANVVDGELFLKNENGCNWSRTYNNSTVVVTAPDLTKIYSATQFVVRSEGVLNFPVLSLQSAMFSKTASGIFDLSVNCEVLTIEDNAASFFRLRGMATDVSVNFYDGNARFDGSELAAQNASFFQRSSNDIILSPAQSVSGKIYSTGNVVLTNVPPIIDVQQFYTGQLILQ